MMTANCSRYSMGLVKNVILFLRIQSIDGTKGGKHARECKGHH